MDRQFSTRSKFYLNRSSQGESKTHMTDRHVKTVGVYVAWGATLIAALWLGGRWNEGKSDARPDGKKEMVEGGTEGRVECKYEHGERPVLSSRLRPGRASAAARLLREPFGQRNIADLIEEAEDDLRAGSGDSGRMLRALQRMHELDPNQISEALKRIGSRPANREQAMLMNAVFSRWAEIDGLSAIEYADRHLSEDLRRDAYRTILGKWTHSEPDAALEWYAQLSIEQESFVIETAKSPFIAGVFQGLAEENLQAAFRACADIPNASDKALAIRGIVNSIGSGAEALELVSQWPDESGRRLGRQFIVKEWSSYDPEAASRWVIENASTIESPQMLNESVSAWVLRDPNSAASWLGKLSGNPLADPATSTLAMGIVGRDPESAFAWASSISNSTMRRATLASVFEQWRIREPDTALNYVQNSDLTSEEIEELLR